MNENKFFNGYPDTTDENLATVKQIGGVDKLGGQDTYEHYPTGWAAAMSTPFKMFKRYSEYAGGTCDPLVMSWPKRIKKVGEVRHQYHHCVDIVPTILEACGLEMPEVYKGREAVPALGRLDVLHLGRGPQRSDKEGAPVLRHARNPWYLGERLEGRLPPCSAEAARATSIKTSGSCTTWTKTAPSPAT